MKVRAVIAPLLLLVLALGGWGAVGKFGLVSDYLVPTPLEVWGAFVQDLGEFAEAFWVTGTAASIRFALSVVLVVFIALALSLSPWLFRAFYPYTVMFQTVPIIAVAPLLVIWFGYGMPTVVVSAFLASVFPVLMASFTGLRAASPELRDLFTLYQASRWNTLFKLILPMALPSLLTGVRIAAGLAVIGAIVGELVGGGGLGSVIDIARTQQRVDKVFAAVVLACALGALAIAAIDVVSRWTLRKWEPR